MAVVNTVMTKMGVTEITNEFHKYYGLERLHNKPVSTFKDDEYLRLVEVNSVIIHGMTMLF